MGRDQPRLTDQNLKVLALLMSRANDELSGAEIGRATKLLSGTLYPILLRLEEAGWAERGSRESARTGKAPPPVLPDHRCRHEKGAISIPRTCPSAEGVCMVLTTRVWMFVVGVLTAALSKILVGEIEAWCPWIVRSLIKLAVARLPENQRARFDEEWQSH